MTTTDLRPYSVYKPSGALWFSSVPADWSCQKLKYVAAVSNVKARPAPLTTFVGLENVRSGDGGFVPGSESAPDSDCLTFQPGDVLFGKLRPYLAKSWLATFGGACSSEFLVLRSRRVAPRYLQYVTLSPAFVESVNSSTYGAKMPRASWDFVGLLGIPLPSVALSHHIAKFLDYETAKIDALIDKQRQLIELLNEKRQAVISHAVTKGLNPDAPMRDSGIEWLGKIPAHWQVHQMKFATVNMQTGPFGSQLHADDYVEGGIPLVNPAHIIDGQIVPDARCSVDPDTRKRLSRHRLSEGDLILARRGELGRCAVVTADQEGWLCGTGCLLVTFSPRLSPDYAALLISSDEVKAELTLESRGSTMDNLNTASLGRIRLPVPPPEEQEEILAYLETSQAQFDRLERLAMKQTDLLQERRAALISAAVTGKIDVRNWKAPDMDPEAAADDVA